MQAAPPPAGRMEQLRKMLEKSPDDTFLLYGIGMEYKKAGDPGRAIEFFNRVIQIDPEYCYAYYQHGQTHEAAGDEDAAKRSYRQGIEAATRKGDAHARSELEAALDLLG